MTFLSSRSFTASLGVEASGKAFSFFVLLSTNNQVFSGKKPIRKEGPEICPASFSSSKKQAQTRGSGIKYPCYMYIKSAKGDFLKRFSLPGLRVTVSANP